MDSMPCGMPVGLTYGMSVDTLLYLATTGRFDEIKSAFDEKRIEKSTLIEFRKKISDRCGPDGERNIIFNFLRLNIFTTSWKCVDCDKITTSQLWFEATVEMREISHFQHCVKCNKHTGSSKSNPSRFEDDEPYTIYLKDISPDGKVKWTSKITSRFEHSLYCTSCKTDLRMDDEGDNCYYSSVGARAKIAKMLVDLPKLCCECECIKKIRLCDDDSTHLYCAECY
jgi:Zn ribbon nucleic-acid-binding protein